MSFSPEQIINLINDEISELVQTGVPVVITNASALENSNNESIIWIKPGSDIISGEKLIKCEAALVVCDRYSYQKFSSIKSFKNYLIVEDPKRIFSKLVNILFVHLPQPGIHTTAVIDPEAEIGEDCYIGPLTYIGKSSVGNNTIIHGNVHIYDNVNIGNNCTIHAGTVIGSEGFGYSKDLNGNAEKFPHIGGVEIGNNIEIGANTCIDRGALGNTVIHDGVKIDNLVHIAHNVIIHPNAFIIANAMLGGSTIIGEGVWIAPSASLKQQLHIGKNATVGIGSVVTKHIPSDEVWLGNPAKEMSAFLKEKIKLKDNS